MNEDHEREYLKEQMFLREKEFEELKELEDSIRIMQKKPAEIHLELHKKEHERNTKINSLPF